MMLKRKTIGSLILISAIAACGIFKKPEDENNNPPTEKKEEPPTKPGEKPGDKPGDKPTLTDEFTAYVPTEGDSLILEQGRSRSWDSVDKEPAGWSTAVSATATVVAKYKAGSACSGYIKTTTGTETPVTYYQNIGCKVEAPKCGSGCELQGEEDAPSADIGMFKGAKAKKTWCVRTQKVTDTLFNRTRTETITYRHKDALSDQRIVGTQTLNCTQTTKSENEAKLITNPCENNYGHSIAFNRSEMNIVAGQKAGTGKTELAFDPLGAYQSNTGTFKNLIAACSHTEAASTIVTMIAPTCNNDIPGSEVLSFSGMGKESAASTTIGAYATRLAKTQQSSTTVYYQQMNAACTVKNYTVDKATRKVSGELSCSQPLKDTRSESTYTLNTAAFACVAPEELLK